jgi:ATP-dependent Lon protease
MAQNAPDSDKATRPGLPPPLPAESLRWRCDPERFPFETTEEIEAQGGVIGQDDAVEALRFGMEISAPGQNIFVRGLTGTGRSTLVRRLLETITPSCPLPADRAYVNNFAQPDRPRLVTLPRGTAESFRRRLDGFISFIEEEFAQGLNSDVVKGRGTEIERRSAERVKEATRPFETELREADLTMVTIQVGPVTRQIIAPVIDGKPAPPERVERLRAEGKLSDEEIEAIGKKIEGFTERLHEVGDRMQEIQMGRAEALHDLLQEEARALLEGAVAGIRKAFSGDDVRTFLDEVIEDMLTRRLGELREGTAFTELYRVNVVLTHREDDPCPAIVEHAPSVPSLMGTIDRTLQMDDRAFAPQMMIRSGSLLRSDGGFLVLEGRDVLTEPGAWKALVRTLRTGRIELVPPELPIPWQIPALKPEPIPVDLKVVMLGDARLYYLLDALDPDFRDHFKVLADFDDVIPRDDEGLGYYASVLARIAKEGALMPFGRDAVARLCEHGARIAAREGKLTARFGRLADLAREAAYLADRAAERVVAAEHVVEAVRRNKRRADLPARRYRELIANGTILVNTQGTAVGQVNALAVMNAGPLTYGFPNRVTATIGAGSSGTINIEREAELSGAIHTKGFYILGGLLRYLLRTDHPLAFSASVAFEQSYGGIDGDSASGAEMCCLLSALTDVPIRQDLAMTGAIDQVGHILPIGAVNEKIEGFFDACIDVRLTGTQGVIIPKTNAGDLMLRQDVVDACAEGRFHVHAVDTIQEAMALFSGRDAGTRGEDGTYPEDSLLGIAVHKAREYWKKAISSGSGATDDEEEEGEDEALDIEDGEDGLPDGTSVTAR